MSKNQALGYRCSQHPLFVRRCHRNVEDRTHWNRQTQGYRIPTVEKKFAHQALNYWRPISKKWIVENYKSKDAAPLYTLLAVLTGLPLVYFLWPKQPVHPVEICANPTTNKNAYKPRPELVTIQEVDHKTAGCPNSAPPPCADENDSPPIKACPVPKPCTENVPSNLGTFTLTVTPPDKE